jgi:hypothetical protein
MRQSIGSINSDEIHAAMANSRKASLGLRWLRN